MMAVAKMLHPLSTTFSTTFCAARPNFAWVRRGNCPAAAGIQGRASDRVGILENHLARTREICRGATGRDGGELL
jgi:hypothetical protein